MHRCSCKNYSGKQRNTLSPRYGTHQILPESTIGPNLRSTHHDCWSFQKAPEMHASRTPAFPVWSVFNGPLFPFSSGLPGLSIGKRSAVQNVSPVGVRGRWHSVKNSTFGPSLENDAFPTNGRMRLSQPLVWAGKVPRKARWEPPEVIHLKPGAQLLAIKQYWNAE